MLRPSLAIAIALALATACGADRPSVAETDGGVRQPDVRSDGGLTPDPPVVFDAGVDASSPGWSARASLPRPMQEVSVVALGGKIYVLGGFDDTGKVLADVAVYDPASDTWSAGVPLPRPLHHANATVAGDRIWIAGALEGAAFTATGTTLVFDPAAGKWLERTAMPSGSERGSAMTAAIGKTIYVAGGIRGAAVADFSAYDTEQGTWSTLTPLAVARDHGVGVAAGGLFYAVSGRSTSLGAHTSRLDVFDPASGKWSPLAPMPTSRAGSAVTIVDGRIIVLGGEGNAAAQTGVFPEAEAYSIMANTWSRLPSMLTPRHGTGAAALDGVVYVPGGGTRQGFGATATVEALRF